MLVNALSRAIADRVILNDVTLGRKGLLGYLKASGRANEFLEFLAKCERERKEASGWFSKRLLACL